jgi:hypothetical protein
MDAIKRRQLIQELSNKEEQVVSISRFFDGNDDVGSIGCNLSEHPGMDVFREVFAQLSSRKDVEAIYVRIFELDPGEGCWPFTDTVFIVGTISPDDLRNALSLLQPDEISPGEDFGVPELINQKHGAPVHAVWWD